MWVTVLSPWNPTLLGRVAADGLGFFHTAQVCKPYPVKSCVPTQLWSGLGPPLTPAHHGTDQVHQLLVADLAPLVALSQSHQHVQLGGVQGQLMAVYQTSEGVRTDEACVLRIQLLWWGSRGWANPQPQG